MRGRLVTLMTLSHVWYPETRAGSQVAGWCRAGHLVLGTWYLIEWFECFSLEVAPCTRPMMEQTSHFWHRMSVNWQVPTITLLLSFIPTVFSIPGCLSQSSGAGDLQDLRDYQTYGAQGPYCQGPETGFMSSPSQSRGLSFSLPHSTLRQRSMIDMIDRQWENRESGCRRHAGREVLEACNWSHLHLRHSLLCTREAVRVRSIIPPSSQHEDAILCLFVGSEKLTKRALQTNICTNPALISIHLLPLSYKVRSPAWASGQKDSPLKACMCTAAYSGLFVRWHVVLNSPSTHGTSRVVRHVWWVFIAGPSPSPNIAFLPVGFNAVRPYHSVAFAHRLTSLNLIPLLSISMRLVPTMYTT